ncbi:MAG: HEAT repeat domain-containing protein [Planctomycetota bacterium]
MKLRLASALALSLALPALAKMPDDEWARVKREAMRDLGASDATTRVGAVKKLAGGDRQEAAEILLKLSSMAQRTLSPLTQEKAKILKSLDNFNGRNRFTEAEVEQMQKLQDEMRLLGQKISAEESVREAVIGALGTFADAEAVAWMLATPLKGSSWEDRMVVAEACATVKSDQVAAALIERVTKDTDPRVRSSAISSLGKRKAVEAASAIAGALSDENWQVQIAALNALSVLGGKDGIELIIALMEKADGRIRKECGLALGMITGEKLGNDAAAWRRWWAEKGGAWDGPKEAEVKPADEPGGTTVTFYGIPVESKRLVFVLDISGSMAQPADVEQQVTSGGPGDEPPPKSGCNKLEVAKYELKKCIRKLDAKAQFNMIFYANAPEKWKANLVSASPANKAAAIAYIEKLEPTSATNIFDSLEMAFNMAMNGHGNVVYSDQNYKKSVDTIYLMSDGAPNMGQITDPTEILAKIREMNRLRKIIIHSIGVGRDQVESFMKSLAEENGGKYVRR